MAALLLSLAAYLGLGPAASEPERDALACAEAYRALLRAVPGEDRPLGQRVLARAAPAPSEGQAARLSLGPVRYRDPLGRPVPELEPALRRSLVQGLRSAAGSQPRPPGSGHPSAPAVEIAGERDALPAGHGFELERSARSLRLTWRPPTGPGETLEIPWSAPDRRSLLPPLIAIALALATRRPIPSLFGGVLVGSILVRARAGAEPLRAIAEGSHGVFTHYLWDKLAAPEQQRIVVFVVLMLAMVGNLTLNGGIQGLVERLKFLARGPRSAQITTYLLGLLIFFDDYANTLLVGSTMRPLTDRFRVAREKLAYLVDSTSAPVAGLSLFSTWIAFEVSTFSAQLPAAGLSSDQGYGVFVQTLPYRFYSWFTLALVGLLVVTGRDFGPMLAAERRARRLGQVLRPGATPMVAARGTATRMPPGVRPAAWRALVPIAAFLAVTLFEIARRGGAFQASLTELFSLQGISAVLTGNNGNAPLMIGSAAGFGLAMLGTLSAGLGARAVLLSAWTTLRSMGVALGILYLSWSIGSCCEDLGTAPYLALRAEGLLEPLLLPLVLFLLASLIAFATGTSWGTMSILLPLVVGLAFQLGEGTALGGIGLMLVSIGAVLEGAIFGDHCSPVSDTTVLSSIASAADHLDHVRTQLPYALTAQAAALGCGYLPVLFLGAPPALCLGVGCASLWALVLLLGRKAEPTPGA